MIPPPNRCVIDANLLVRTIIVEDYSRDILVYVARFGQDVEVFAPNWIILECANALRRAILAKRYPEPQAAQDIQDLFALAINYTPTEMLVPPAMTISIRYGISVYDAVYVALANQLNCPILTGDQRLVNGLAGSRIGCIALGEVFHQNSLL